MNHLTTFQTAKFNVLGHKRAYTYVRTYYQTAALVLFCILVYRTSQLQVHDIFIWRNVRSSSSSSYRRLIATTDRSGAFCSNVCAQVRPYEVCTETNFIFSLQRRNLTWSKLSLIIRGRYFALKQIYNTIITISPTLYYCVTFLFSQNAVKIGPEILGVQLLPCTPRAQLWLEA